MINPQASRAIAAEKWPGAKVSGYGEWALCLFRNEQLLSVHLFPTEGAAYQASERVPGCWSIEQLKLPCPFPEKCKGDLGYE